MAETLTFFEAARKYGFNDATETSDITQIFGEASQPTITGNLAVGNTVTMTIPFAKGFSDVVSVFINSPATMTISLVQIKSPTGELLATAQGSITFSASNLGDVLTAPNLYAGNDTMYGNSANNKLEGFGGNDRIDGGAGLDTVVLRGLSTQYQVSRSGTSMTVTGPDGTDTLLNIERLQFDNATVAYDTAGTAGAAYRLYQAAFNRTPDAGGLGFWTHTLDSGASLQGVAQGFISSGEFSAKYGSLDNAQFVNQLYLNVLHRAADAGGLAYWSSNLNAGALDRAQTLAFFSESPENQAAVIGVIQDGITFTG